MTRDGTDAPQPADNRRTQRLRRQLQESNDRYELVAKATNDVIYDLDISQGTVVWNDALYDKYGYRRTEPAGTVEWWAAHVHPDDAARIEAEIGGLLSNDHDTWQSRYRFRTADGSYAVVRDRAFVLRGDDGQPRRIIGSMLDITESDRLDRAKDEFSSLVSHQLRTPLTIIQLYSDMLGGGMLGGLTDDQTEYLQRINNASRRLSRLVGNILDISRLEMAKSACNPQPTDLATYVASLVGELRPLAAGRGISLQVRGQAGCPSVALDQSMLREVLLNLLTNAIHYSPAGSGRVRLSYRVSGGRCSISVSDNGIGIPAAARPHIFGRFYRADNAADSGSEGTGLGLYLSRLLTEAMGGDISYSSTAGKGTVFRVRIPS